MVNLVSGWRFAGAERGSRFSQFVLDLRRERMRSAKHAQRSPFQLLERGHGLAEVVERGAGILVWPLVSSAHLCDFHDARVALITTSPTPEPAFGNGTAATRRHARHPEGTLFLGFLLALLVLVAVLGAPCRRSLGDAVLLPDEEDM